MNVLDIISKCSMCLKSMLEQPSQQKIIEYILLIMLQNNRI